MTYASGEFDVRISEMAAIQFTTRGWGGSTLYILHREPSGLATSAAQGTVPWPTWRDAGLPVLRRFVQKPYNEERRRLGNLGRAQHHKMETAQVPVRLCGHDVR